MYNSDSDESGDEDDQALVQGQRGKQQPGKNASNAKPARKDRHAGEQQYIRNEGDQPMDLLSRSIAGGVSRKWFLLLLCCMLPYNRIG